MSSLTPSEINDLRIRVIRGEQVSNEELREAIKFHQNLRGRFAEKVEKEDKPKKETKAKVDVLALGKELGI